MTRTTGAAARFAEPLALVLAEVWTRLLDGPPGDEPWAAGGVLVEYAAAGSERPLRIELDRTLTAALIDAQAGATHLTPVSPRETLTEIDRALVKRAADALRIPLAHVLDGRVTLTSVERVESLSKEADGEPAEPAADGSDELAAATLRTQVRLLESRGELRLRLSRELYRELTPPPPPEPARQWTAVLAELELPREEIEALEVGDVILTDAAADAPIQMQAEGVEPRRVEPGRCGDLKAVRPADKLTEPPG